VVNGSDWSREALRYDVVRLCLPVIHEQWQRTPISESDTDMMR
jgi:hypothetical protein